MEEPWRSQSNVGLGKHHENLSKNGMNPILSSLYNPYKAIPFPITSLWSSKQSDLWNTDLGLFLNYYYICLLCGSFDGAHLNSSRRFCPWLSICLPEAQSPSILDLLFLLDLEVWDVNCEKATCCPPPIMPAPEFTSLGTCCVHLARCPICSWFQKDSNVPISSVWKHNVAGCK